MAANQGGGERGMYCRFCEKKNEADSLFCINCGKPMDITHASQEKPMQPQQAPIERPQETIDKKTE